MKIVWNENKMPLKICEINNIEYIQKEFKGYAALFTFHDSSH